MEDRFHCEVSWPPVDPGAWTSRVWTDLARKAFGRWLEANPSATAVICHNDMGAFGALEAMKRRGLKPGKDLSIVGYDNVEERGPVPAETPILTTVDNPTDRIGRRCAEVLLNQMIHDQRQIVHEHIPVCLVVRRTTGPVPGSPRGKGKGMERRGARKAAAG
jgi:LacI family transcriptional regulator